ncbi:MAG: hypothetical protein JKY60_20525 [Kordiimonadaceae bacterium]|nr:hypothetical protein [Kordiimonadaceae bacterium]
MNSITVQFECLVVDQSPATYTLDLLNGKTVKVRKSAVLGMTEYRTHAFMMVHWFTVLPVEARLLGIKDSRPISER